MEVTGRLKLHGHKMLSNFEVTAYCLVLAPTDTRHYNHA